MRIVIVAAMAWIGVAFGRPVVEQSQPIETAHLSVKTATNVTGQRTWLVVDITPKPKMHVYAPGEKDAIPVELTLDPNPAFNIGKAIFPPPQKYFFAPLKLTQLVYSKPFRITQPITVTRRPATGPLAITGTLQYQACDDAVCFVPKTVGLKWELNMKSSIPE
jgi:DsbC/DsbD-like thiol-disulfide interchange protein